MTVQVAAEDRTFRPRRARVVGWGFAIGIFVVMVGVSIGLSFAPDSGWSPSDTVSAVVFAPDSGWSPSDTVSAVVFALIVSGGLVRLVSVRALVTADALVVRNVIFTREVAWGEVVAVRFGGADPWLTLDLDDGENLAVMGVQRADGQFARDEALRLARLVESRAPRVP